MSFIGQATQARWWVLLDSCVTLRLEKLGKGKLTSSITPNFKLDVEVATLLMRGGGCFFSFFLMYFFHYSTCSPAFRNGEELLYTLWRQLARLHMQGAGCVFFF